MNLNDVETFLVLCEELSFHRAGERLFVSGNRVGQRIRCLERDIGTPLFERTSRRVTLTPVGAQLRDDLAPAYQQLTAALDTAKATGRAVTGEIRLGFTQTTGGTALDELITAFERTHPRSRVHVREVPLDHPFDALRAGELDAVLTWLVGDAADLAHGPVVHHAARALMVSAGHPLARRRSVSTDDFADYPLPSFVPDNPADTTDTAYRDAIIPAATATGRPLAVHPTRVRSATEGALLVTRGSIVWPTVVPTGRYGTPEGIVFVPISDLPPLPLGIVWVRCRTTARIRALAATVPQ